MPVFHNEQRIASREIIAMFQKQPMTILLAQMQSGKTGTYLFTALEMIRQGLVEDVVIICGSSDTSLRSQAENDLEAAKDAYLDEVESREEVVRLVRICRKIQLHFSQDLERPPRSMRKLSLSMTSLTWHNPRTTSLSSPSIRRTIFLLLSWETLKS